MIGYEKDKPSPLEIAQRRLDRFTVGLAKLEAERHKLSEMIRETRTGEIHTSCEDFDAQSQKVRDLYVIHRLGEGYS